MRYLVLVTLFSIVSFPIFAQSDITGTWNTGEQNTHVKIEKENDVFIGKVISSDNPKAKTGSTLVKEVKLKKNKWVGQLYAPKRGEWYNAEFTKKGNILEIEVSVGFMSKLVEWTKVAKE